MSLLDYLCSSAAWSVLWFLLGVLSTLAAQNLIELLKTRGTK